MANRGSSWALAWAFGCALASVVAAKESCLPPVFYTSLPRDSDWYYGVARDADTDKARELAIRNLGKQVTGDLEAWKQADVDTLAGPGHDRWEVAAHVGKLLPTSTLLAGWEQDDFERCNDYSYVLVRIEKDRVSRFIKQSKPFQKDLSDSFDKRLKKVEKDVSLLNCRMAELKKRMDRLTQALQKFPQAAQKSGFAAPESQKLSQRLNQVRELSRKGAEPSALEKSLAGIEGDYGQLLGRMHEYQKTHDSVEQTRLAAVAAENSPLLKDILARIGTGKAKYVDVARAVGLYQDAKQFPALHGFCERLLSGRVKIDLEGHDDFFAYMAITADISLKDDDKLFADGEKFLKKYPGSNMYEAVKAEMEGTMAMKNMPSAPSDLSLPPLQDDPCPGS